MADKKNLTVTELNKVKGGLPAPPKGYEYCSGMFTCPAFYYKICIYPTDLPAGVAVVHTFCPPEG